MPPSQIKVAGQPTLIRDRHSNAVLNRNTSAYKTRLAFKRGREKTAAETAAMKQDIADLKAQVAALLAAQK
jgi:hypothetical protein